MRNQVAGRSHAVRPVDQPEDALFQAFERSRITMFAVARRIVGDDLAGDVVQQAITRAWQNLDQYDPARGTIRSYLHTLTRGIAIDVLRETNRRRDRETRKAGLERSWSVSDELGTLIRDEHAVRVSVALGCLNDNERDLINLAFYGEHTHRQIAAELDLPLGTVKSRIRAALSKLRVALVDLSEAAPLATRVVLTLPVSLMPGGGG